MDVTLDTSIGDGPALFLAGHRHPHMRREHAQRRRTFNHRLRAAAKQYRTERPEELPCQHIGFGGRDECRIARRAQQDGNDAPRLRSHIEADLRWRHYHEEHGPRMRSKRGNPRAHLNHEGSIELARSKIVLPGDQTLQRCPSLERQDAFCDSRTKGHVRIVKPLPAGFAEDDDAQVAQLYRMGLLYDEQDAPSQSQIDADIHLDDIQHAEPAYSIRPARRRSGRPAKSGHRYDEGLPLDLSFADLGTDDDLAPYLSTQEGSRATTDRSSPSEHHARRASHQTAPLRVIYELATARPSFDVDTSQPPDLMNDSLSDYDCVTDSELDDAPSQREIHDPAGPWVLLGDDEV